MEQPSGLVQQLQECNHRRLDQLRRHFQLEHFGRFVECRTEMDTKNVS